MQEKNPDREVTKHAENCFRSLHKGLGVRRPDLRKRLGPELRTRWGIADDDPATLVRAKTVARLEALLTELSDPRLWLAVTASYNLVPDPETNGLSLGARQQHLSTKPGAKFSVRTIERLIERFQDEMGVRLSRPFEPIAVEWLRSIMAREQATEPPAKRAPRRRGVVRQNGLPDLQAAIHDFMTTRVYTPDITVRTRAKGDWLCVFTSAESMDTYQRATGASWPSRAAIAKGADFVQEISREPGEVGILVDPPPSRGGDLAETLMLTPSTIRALAAKL